MKQGNLTSVNTTLDMKRKTPDWALELATDINNQFELGLSDREFRSLAYVIHRRAVPAKTTTEQAA